ncbi:hypothetical protein G6F46_011533 [Rhizopus delemar]|uniref:Uncharacterized protein n=3 Tax=Rhizopus TaxID=4842 RepID=I1C834_RHIO9|nr:hypothetical protein RO3G_09324 [Rhizopus delemar RA 99-880]KAG1446865.1 hypothetical protein G6F55_011363 [Rhizopus delemar]KAG1534862.1 hypothetical protein G6F51_011852 [Rhizopus arrhizus]KAG1490052.1 hypothetical protein G6F54_011004 [Rhizopus delemar]KAG1498919.1 hypothetical protein G6F53_011639 [Rhizopus delemar]|eukprot:EIE84614.1 hypothetical protein RO3G_09324 [Rhizopus delemar RA 99-880]
MATDQEVHAQLQQTNAERHFLELQIEVFAVLKGTLGERTLSVGSNMELKNWKCKWIAYLCLNVIIDFTRTKRDLIPLSNATKKARQTIENRASAKICLKKIEAHDYADSNERATKMIYVHISNREQADIIP